MIIIATCARVLRATTRFTRTLLMRVSVKTMNGSRDAMTGNAAAAAADDDDDDEEERAYTQLRQFIVVYDNDVLPSCDARIEYLIDVEPLDRVRPTTLQGTEARLQREPSSKYFLRQDDANALPYRLSEVVGVVRIVKQPVTLTTLANALPTSARKSFRQFENQRHVRPRARAGRPAPVVYTSLAAIEAALRASPALVPEGRRNALEALVDAFASLDQIDLSVEQLAAPSSAVRLSAIEASRLLSYTRSLHDLAAADDDAEPELDVAAWKRLPKATNAAVGRFCDFLPLADVGTRRRLRPSPGVRRRFDALKSANTFDVLANTMRASSSTTGIYYGDERELRTTSVGNALVRHLSAFRVVGTYERASDGAQLPLLAGGRDDDLEREAARLLHDERAVGAWWALTVQAGSFGVYEHLHERLETLGIHDSVDGAVLVVAPTVAHALAMPFDCLSIDDVLSGAVPQRRCTTLVLVVAHALGVDSFVHAVRLVQRAGGGDDDDDAPPLTNVVLVGDHLTADGSPRESDRGAPMRDVVAALRHGHIGERGHVDMLLLYTNETDDVGALDETQWRRLRCYNIADDAAWPDADDDDGVMQRHDTVDTVPLGARELVVVGTSTMSEALKAAKCTIGDAMSVQHYVAIDELGEVARVSKARRVDAVTTLDALVVAPVAVASMPDVEQAPVALRGLHLELAESTVNHRHCCRTAVASHVNVAVHPTLRPLAAAPARHVARTAQRAIVDELTFIVTERTGIEDVRAAFMLARHRVHVVGADEHVVEAVRRHAPRPRTRLVTLSRDIVEVAAASSLSLLAYDDAVARDRDRSMALVYAGSYDRTRLVTAAVGTEVGGAQRYLVPLERLSRHTTEFLVPPDAPPRKRARTDDRVFDATRLTREAMARVSRRKLDAEVMRRLWALVVASPRGRLGADQSDEFLRTTHDAYVAEAATSGIDVELEAVAVHALALVVKRSATAWFLDAERQLYVERGGDDGDHVNAVAKHVARVHDLPDGSTEASDDYDLFAKLREVRDYVEEALRDDEAD